MGGKKGARGLTAKERSTRNYVTRNKAIRMLQLSLGEFRKICILKGIYPRKPEHFFKGTDKIYYFTKDIKHLERDPIIKSFRECARWRKRISKARIVGDKKKLKALLYDKPQYDLVHLVKERYPSFMDALRDLDDALNVISLFALMPVRGYVSAQRINNCVLLIRSFEYYVARTHGLRKVFVSIKGVYFQAVICGQRVTWMRPHSFNQDQTRDANMRVMATFLEFYELLMGFVNYKLFRNIGLKYPPVFADLGDMNGSIYGSVIVERLDGVASFLGKVERRVESVSAQDEKDVDVSGLSEILPALEGLEVEDEDVNDSAKICQNSDDFTEMEGRMHESDECATLFSQCVFFVSREVPLGYMEFILRSFGAKDVLFENGKSLESSPSITHQIVDRGCEPTNRRLDREYVQPQWVFDSVNYRILLPVEKYGPTSALPPHLSPFVSYKRGSYVPEYRKEIDRLISQCKNRPLPTYGEEPESESLDEEESDDDEQIYARELAEELGIENIANSTPPPPSPHSSQNTKESILTSLSNRKNAILAKRLKASKSKTKGALQDAQDNKEMLQSIVSSKNRRILLQRKRRIAKKMNRTKALISQREKIKSGKLLVKNGRLVTATIPA